MAAIPPVQFFSPAAQHAAEVSALTAAQNGAATAAAAPATTATFSAVLGQVLAALGPLAFDTTLTNIGAGGNATNTGIAGGLTNTVFTLLLLNSLGVGQTGNTGNTNTQNAIQQLLVTQLLISATGTNDTTGLGELTAEQLAASLAQQPAAGNTFLSQLANVSTFPNPVLFSASALAQAFQVGNGTGSPA